MKRITLLIVLSLHCSLAYGQFKYWEQLSGPNGGRVNTTSIDSTQRVLIGTGIAGIFESTNNGDTWRPMNKGLRALQIRRVESGPDGYYYMYNFVNEIARFHDIDKGWEYLTPWENPAAVPVVGDILASPKGTLYLVGYKQGIRRSNDHGSNWEYADTSLKGINFRLLAATVSADTLYALTDSGYVYRSINGGDSWTMASGRQPNPKVLAECFEVSAGGDLIIASQRDEPGGKVYRSTDGGATWSLVFSHPFDHVSYALVRSQFNGDLYMTTHSPPDSKQQTYTGGFYRSTDNGATWQLRTDSELGEDKFSLAVNKQGWIFHGSVPDGIVRSTDRGFTWTEKNDGLLAQYLQGTAVNSKGDLFALTQFALYRSINPNPGSLNPGDIWQQVPIEQLESFQEPLIRVSTNDVIYQGSFFGLYRSEDKGDHWAKVLAGDTNNQNNHIYDLQTAPNAWVFAASERTGLMYSQDSGKSWTKVPNLPALPEGKMTAIAFSGDTIMCISEEGVCWRSTNKGVNWIARTSSAVLGGTSTLVRASDGSFVALMVGEAKRSTDGGATWEHIFPSAPLTEIRPFWAMYSMFGDSRGDLLIGTDTGVWRSRLPFEDWEQIGFGITAPDYRRDHYCNVAQFAEDPNTGFLFAASRGQSMFRSTQPFAGVRLSPAVALASGQNYPNPFSALTTIEVQLDKPGVGDLQVFTALGERVLSRTEGVLTAGKYAFSFDGSQLASGNYFYVLSVENKPIAKGWMQVVH